jgi:hypothetical protein
MYNPDRTAHQLTMRPQSSDEKLLDVALSLIAHDAEPCLFLRLCDGTREEHRLEKVAAKGGERRNGKGITVKPRTVHLRYSPDY